MFSPALAPVRRLLRPLVPQHVRLTLRLTRRALNDRLRRVPFARSRADASDFPCRWSERSSGITVYPGQERSASAKRHNIALMARALDGTVIAPGEVFSLWRLAGRPGAGAGYADAAGIRDGRLVEETGGSVCLVSTVIYHAAVEAGLDIVERRSHSLDTYGADRYFALGLDATIEYGYIDLRLRNQRDVPLRVTVELSERGLTVQVRGPVPPRRQVELEVRPLEAPDGIIRVETVRTLTPPVGPPVVESLGVSEYRQLAVEASDDGARCLQASSVRSDRSSPPS